MLVLSLEGRLDHAGAEEFRKTAEAAVAGGQRSVVVDFQGVDFLASMGIRALLVPSQRVAQAGGRFALAGLGRSVRSVFELSGLDKVFQSYPTVAEALADGEWPLPAA